jgi:hypothetical protein
MKSFRCTASDTQSEVQQIEYGLGTLRADVPPASRALCRLWQIQIQNSRAGLGRRVPRRIRHRFELAPCLTTSVATTFPSPGTAEADQRRQSFGAQADAYTKFRPGYPPEVFDYLLGLVNGAGRTPDVVDIGAGTGQLTVGFAARDCRVIGVEPDDRMRQVLASREGIADTFAGSAEALPLPDSTPI